jgi:hypothetical protein
MFGFVVLFLVSLQLILWGWALIDILKSEFTGDNKVIWLLVVIFVPLLGMIAYYFIGTKQKITAK